MEDNQHFETLDPKDWNEARLLMHRMVDDAVDYLSTVRARPAWQQMPEHILDSFSTNVPIEPESPEAVYEQFTKQVLPYPMGNIHPRFWAWYMGNGTLSGVMGDFWASVMNPNLGGANHAANKLEEQVVEWMKEIMAFPSSSSGLLVSGGSMANYVGLVVARTARAGFDIRKEGIHNAEKRITFYASTEVHSSNQKAIELLGHGSDSLRKVPVLADYTIDIQALKQMVKQDRENGMHPVCVIGTSGTINTGAIDDLNKLADFCESEDLWFHVDGAIGGIAVLAETAKPLLSGIERADSLAIDLHKWMHMPFEAGVALVKDNQAHKDSFSLIPEYLARKTRGLAAGDVWFSEYGLQLTRRFRALKIWMSLKEHGTKRFGRMIDRNIDQAKYVGERVAREEVLELMAPIGLDIICFRFNPGDIPEEELNAINQEIKIQLEEKGIAAPGYTTLGTQYCIRFAIANHRSTYADFDVVIDAILEIGDRLIE
jgi:glutamate/tyrosine decarboxylase-like PLP-dependent enzyme